MMSQESVQDPSVPTAAADRRRSELDRRRAPRPGQPGRRRRDVVRALAFLCSLLASTSAMAETRIGFGFDANSLKQARELGLPVSYGSVWAGAWNQEKYGWGGIEDMLN